LKARSFSEKAIPEVHLHKNRAFVDRCMIVRSLIVRVVKTLAVLVRALLL
jgi:hypothetical protein